MIKAAIAGRHPLIRRKEHNAIIAYRCFQLLKPVRFLVMAMYLLTAFVERPSWCTGQSDCRCAPVGNATCPASVNATCPWCTFVQGECPR